jgi:hypothetical protein
LEKIIIIIGGGRGSLEVERGATMTVSIDRTLALFAQTAKMVSRQVSRYNSPVEEPIIVDASK